MGHDPVNIDAVGIEPTTGFLLNFSHITNLRDTTDGKKPRNNYIVGEIKFKGDMGLIGASKGDSLTIVNGDANAYRFRAMLSVNDEES